MVNLSSYCNVAITLSLPTTGTDSCDWLLALQSLAIPVKNLHTQLTPHGSHSMSGVAPPRRPRPIPTSQSDCGNGIEPALHIPESQANTHKAPSIKPRNFTSMTKSHRTSSGFTQPLSYRSYQCIRSVLFLSHCLDSLFLLVSTSVVLFLSFFPLASFLLALFCPTNFSACFLSCSAISVNSFISSVIFFSTRRFFIPEPLPFAYSYLVINWENFALNHAHDSCFLFLVLAHLVVLEPCNSKSISSHWFSSILFCNLLTQFWQPSVKACSWRGGRFWGSGEWVFLSEYVDCRMRRSGHPWHMSPGGLTSLGAYKRAQYDHFTEALVSLSNKLIYARAWILDINLAGGLAIRVFLKKRKHPYKILFVNIFENIFRNIFENLFRNIFENRLDAHQGYRQTGNLCDMGKWNMQLPVPQYWMLQNQSSTLQVTYLIEHHPHTPTMDAAKPPASRSKIGVSGNKQHNKPNPATSTNTNTWRGISRYCCLDERLLRRVEIEQRLVLIKRGYECEVWEQVLQRGIMSGFQLYVLRRDVENLEGRRDQGAGADY
ncbi:hypothetical protein VP01_3066g1 [Puccinia sorghi]|uniref:Uncharacterized protein n=1 Tax=Puccinia sorghi TaxID=27349 RepID=A0A0L6UZR2_9BASI|nr:hypothetical protein VP01_3066g1 [Puccinia sorghi]